MDCLRTCFCCDRWCSNIQTIERYITSRQGTTLVLPWPKDWKLTLWSLQVIPCLFEEDVTDMCKSFTCCEKKLTVIGVLHHSMRSSFHGPILLASTCGHLYVFNQALDNALYYVARDFEELFVTGLRNFYPVYDSTDFLINCDTAEKLISKCLSFNGCRDYRDKNLSKNITLNTYPFTTYLRFANLRMTKYKPCDINDWKRKIDTTDLDVLFLCRYNHCGKWKDLILLVELRGLIFAIDDDGHIVYMSKDLREFLKIGCHRYGTSARFYTDWFSQTSCYIKQTEERFSRPIICPRGIFCKRKNKLLSCIYR